MNILETYAEEIADLLRSGCIAYAFITWGKYEGDLTIDQRLHLKWLIDREVLEGYSG